MPNKLSLRPATVSLPELQEDVRKTEAVGFELTALALTVHENEDLNALIYRNVAQPPPQITLHAFDASADEALQQEARIRVASGNALAVAEGIVGVNGQEQYVIASRAAAIAQPVDPRRDPGATQPEGLFAKLAAAYADFDAARPQLKAVTLAQWALESGRGKSDLAIQHFNFGGLKWRKEMQGFATPVAFLAHDGLTDYCKFENLEAFIRGYWQFLTRPPYRGWEQHAASGEAFMRFIGPIYCPDGGYVNEVLDLLPEAEDLLGRTDSSSRRTLIPRSVDPDPGASPGNQSVSDVEGTVVLDPGHGGTQKVGGSSPNNAISATGIKEKKIVLEFAFLIRESLRRMAPKVRVILTRDTDINIGIKARAAVAANSQADLFLSLHCNGFNSRSRGVETWVRSAGHDNVNLAEDLEFASHVQTKVFQAIRQHDPAVPDRGIKTDDERDDPLGVLNDDALGNSAGRHVTRACLVEIEFIDVPTVDALLNTGEKAARVRADIAKGIATAIIDQLT